MKKRAEPPERVAWKMFEKTGNPSYYLLYKKLTGIK